ncbi:Hydrocephalus-inducing protein [Ceratobasidium sp. AG-Ba]|nr:Hydrocephalus-inducing protein [Ceratobasidium sp. AG-Ba]QRV85121.1 Hydrocephalus-inducing protein [Ceratobasidium sp. AG-Ba]
MATSSSFRFPVVSPCSEPERFSQIVEAVARSQNIFIVCGESLSREAGLPPIENPVDENFSSGITRKSLRTLLRECSLSVVSPEMVDQRSLASVNAAMASRRRAARTAQMGAFADLLASFAVRGNITGYLTSSIDGLESRVMPNLEDRIFRLNGDNRKLLCGRNRCLGIEPGDSTLYDEALLGAPTTVQTTGHLSVYCNDCRSKWIKTAISKRRYGDKTLVLRPAVQFELDAEYWKDEVKSKMLPRAELSQLLLIVENPIKPRSLIDDVVSDLADAVHKMSGAVIYVSLDLTKGKATYTHIDAQLQTTAADLALGVMEAHHRLDNPRNQLGDEEYVGPDFWFDVIRNQLVGTSHEEDEDVVGEICERCSMSVPEYLVQCRACKSCFCHRRVCYNDSWDGDLDSGDGSMPQDRPPDDDPFPFHTACIAFDLYSSSGRRPRLEEAKRNFLCYDCWDRTANGLYPHYVSPIPRLRDQPAGTQPPRMIFVLFYAEQFWPVASHLLAMVAARWANKGWACKTYPVKIEHISEQKPVFDDLAWERASYVALIAYLTHGLSGDRGYQVAPRSSLPPTEFLDLSLGVVDRALRNAREARAIMVCCGGPLQHSGFVQQLAEWLNRPDRRLESLLCAMNTRLSPAYMVTLIAKISTTLVDPDPDASETLFRLWISDTLAASHTNVLYLAREAEPTMWLYAPFQSRPLGKALPNIMSACSCPGLSPGEYRLRRRQGSRKTWDVNHNGRDGQLLQDVVVYAMCSICGQSWPLLSDYFSGRLRKYAGVFAAVVPYFFAPTSGAVV